MVLDQECQTRKGKRLLRPEEKKVEIDYQHNEKKISSLLKILEIFLKAKSLPINILLFFLRSW